MTVNLKATFKKDQKEYNGLDDEPIRKGLIEEPLARRYVVAMIETSKVVKDIEAGGTLVPTVRVISIEVCDGDNAIVVKEILDTLFKTRTGRHVDPTLFDRDDPQANADAEHVSSILDGMIPPAPAGSDQDADAPSTQDTPGDDTPPPAAPRGRGKRS